MFFIKKRLLSCFVKILIRESFRFGYHCQNCYFLYKLQIKFTNCFIHVLLIQRKFPSKFPLMFRAAEMKNILWVELGVYQKMLVKLVS